jgi:hypothetical protein
MRASNEDRVLKDSKAFTEAKLDPKATITEKVKVVIMKEKQKII